MMKFIFSLAVWAICLTLTDAFTTPLINSNNKLVPSSKSQTKTTTSRWNNNKKNTNGFVLFNSDNNNDGVVELADDDDEGSAATTATATTEAAPSEESKSVVAPFLSQGEINPEVMEMDWSDPKQTRVMIYIILSLLPVLFLIPLMLASRDLIPMEMLPPVDM